MNLSNFETNFTSKILERGLMYYREGNVENLEFEHGVWTAEVSGSSDYTVTVTMSDNGEVLASICDCPYDQGEFCKHQAAVFYALRNGVGVKAPSKPSLKQVLDKQDKGTLIGLLLEIAANDRAFKNELMLRFSNQKMSISFAKELIRSSIKSATKRHYVDYEHAYDAVSGAEKVLAYVQKNRNGDALFRFELCALVLEEMTDLLAYCDDSDGAVGGAIYSVLEVIKEIISNMKPASKDVGQMVANVLKHAQKAVYDGWREWRFDLVTALIPFCGVSEYRNAVEAYLESIYPDERSDYSTRFERKQIDEMMFRIILENDGMDSADQFAEKHLDNDVFREKLILGSIKSNRVDKALELCLDGERQDKGYAGLVSRWKELRYQVYEKQGDKSSCENLAHEMLLSGMIDYLEKYKALIPTDRWIEKRDELLEQLQKGWQGNRIYLKILIDEGLKSRLLTYVEKHPNSVVGLYKYLIPEYAADVEWVFSNYILSQAQAASDRSGYRHICGLIKVYSDACGEKLANEMRGSLCGAYPRRPVFLDELKKMRL